jgi:hypothetical protein
MLNGQKLRKNDIVDEVGVDDELPNQIRQKRNRNLLILQSKFLKMIIVLHLERM